MNIKKYILPYLFIITIIICLFYINYKSYYSSEIIYKELENVGAISLESTTKKVNTIIKQHHETFKKILQSSELLANQIKSEQDMYSKIKYDSYYNSIINKNLTSYSIKEIQTTDNIHIHNISYLSYKQDLKHVSKSYITSTIYKKLNSEDISSSTLEDNLHIWVVEIRVPIKNSTHQIGELVLELDISNMNGMPTKFNKMYEIKDDILIA